MKTSQEPSIEEIAQLARRYGTNTNAFLTLYDGYSTFRAPEICDGVIRYCRTYWAWVAAAEPLCAPEHVGAMLAAFSAAAKANGKAAIVLPVAREHLPAARAAGFAALQIGVEPVFFLEKTETSASRFAGSLSLLRRGATVTRHKFAEMDATLRGRLDRLATRWLATRKMDELHFLNRVRLWERADEKAYFVLEREGEIIAALSATPIPQRRGWYFVDLLRDGKAPAGSTELLILEAMRMLYADGDQMVSLGVSPLAGLPDPKLSDFPQMTRLLRTTYRSGTMFYAFDSLFEFKNKFRPHALEPAYLLLSPKKIGARQALALSDVFTGGVTRSVLSTVSRGLRGKRVTPVRALRFGSVLAFFPSLSVFVIRAWPATKTTFLMPFLMISFAFFSLREAVRFHLRRRERTFDGLLGLPPRVD